MISSYSVAARATRSREPVSEPLVNLRARLLQKPAIGDVADQNVAEAEGILALEAATAVA